MQVEGYAEGWKRCCRCKADLPTTDFYRATKRPDGLQTICKVCTRQHNEARKQANPDWWRPYRSEYVLTDAQRKANAERARKWHQANRDQARVNGIRWASENPSKVREMARKRSAIRRARKAAAFVEPVDAVALWERDNGVCGICSLPISGSFDYARFEVDHIIPLAKGGEHSYANTQIAHQACNRRKWAHLPTEFAVAG